jgi:hypothetical protein
MGVGVAVGVTACALKTNPADRVRLIIIESESFFMNPVLLWLVWLVWLVWLGRCRAIV